MRQVSFFHKGINTDLDYSKMANDGLLLPTSNIRLLNKKGQGLIITAVAGNEKSFSINRGFVIIGATEHNGVAYIIAKQYLLEGQKDGPGMIGSFPSPNPQTGKMEEVFRPLQNLYVKNVLGKYTLLPMTTKLLEFDWENPVGDQMIALPDYDNSVNIIFTDGVRPIRMVNSGFDQTGKALPERYYHSDTLKDTIALIKGSPLNQKITVLEETAGGNLSYGNYFFFYRYVISEGNKTEYVAESAPVALTTRSSENSYVRVSGDNENARRKVVLEVDNLDRSFAHIEFAFIKFSSTEESVVTTEIFAVDKLVGIPESPGPVRVEITGFETLVPLDIAELLKPVNNEDVVKTIIGYDRRLWGGNWTARQINYKALEQFAQKVRLAYDDKKEIGEEELRTFYSDGLHTKYAGYFRGEAYMGRMAFKLKNGYETEAFPVRGIDAREVPSNQILSAYSNDAIVNNQGVIIMPYRTFSPFIQNRKGRILGMVFNFADAKSWIAKSGEMQQWVKENVKEIILVRAKRKENMLYQGLSSKVYGRADLGLGDLDYEKNSVSIPLLDDQATATVGPNEGLPTMTYDRSPSGLLSSFFQARSLQPHTGEVQSEEEKKIVAIFSPDFILGRKTRVQNGDRLHVERIGSMAYDIDENDQLAPANYYLKYSGFSQQPMGGFESNNTSVVHDLNNWITPAAPAPMRLINRAKDLGREPFTTPDPTQAIFWGANHGNVVQGHTAVGMSNRNIQTLPYFACSVSNVNTPGWNNEARSIMAVYKRNPRSSMGYFLDLYLDQLNIPYSRVHESNLSFAQLQDSVVCYQGDSYVQLSTFKARTWFPTEAIGTDRAYDERTFIGASISKKGVQVSNDALNDAFWAGILGGGLPGAVIAYFWPRHQDPVRAAATKYRYAHGLLVDMVTENSINTALRFSHHNANKFYPAVEGQYISWDTGFHLSREDWAVYPFSSEVSGWDTALGTGIESHMVNRGNAENVSLKMYLAFNPNIPKGIERFPNRIRYTGRQEPNRPFLEYRVWDYYAREDFDERYGEIMKLILPFGRLVSVQHSSIFLHRTNQEESVPSSSGEMIIGVRSILSKHPSVLARFGTQHPLSIKQAKSGTFGWDWVNGAIWRLVMDEEGNLIARALQKDLMFESYLRELQTRMGDQSVLYTSNIVRGLKDQLFLTDRLQREGLITSYSPQEAQVYLTVVYKEKHETIVIDEDLNSFVGNLFYPFQFSFNIQRDLFKTPFSGFPEDVYIHGRGESATFFGKAYRPVFSFIVNGYDEESPMVLMDKAFHAMEIETPKTLVPIKKVEFQTTFQKGKNDPFINPSAFWLHPEYNLSKYSFPLNISFEAEGFMEQGSPMIGKWLKVTVTMEEKTQAFVKNIITIFTTSKA